MSSRTPLARRRRDGGFSLLEVMSGLTIFGLVAIGAAAGTMSTIRGNTVSRMTLAASNLIYDQVENFRSLDPTLNPAEFTEGVHQDPNNPITATGEADGAFFRSWTVTRNSPAVGLAEVQVTVSWRDTEERSLTYATYLCLVENCS